MEWMLWRNKVLLLKKDLCIVYAKMRIIMLLLKWFKKENETRTPLLSGFARAQRVRPRSPAVKIRESQLCGSLFCCHLVL